MPYKFNESRRHKIPRARYRVTNWPEYDAALFQRGSIAVWCNEEAVAAWHAPATGARRRGRRRHGAGATSILLVVRDSAAAVEEHRTWRQQKGGFDVVGFMLAATFL